MTLTDFLQALLGTRVIEIVASLSGLACVALLIRRSLWSWPVGLVQVALYMLIFFEVKLYSDVLLHGIYVVMQLYGWWYWWSGKAMVKTVRVEGIRYPDLALWAGVALLGAAFWGWGMSLFTDANMPYADAFILVTSLVAQWLIVRRQLMSWGFWIAVDLVAIGVYLQAGLFATSLLYGVFLLMSMGGFLAWRRQLRLQTQAAPAASAQPACA